MGEWTWASDPGLTDTTLRSIAWEVEVGRGGLRRVAVVRWHACVCAAKSCPGVPERATASVAALRRLPCDARSPGPVGQLVALTAFVPLKHSLPNQMTKRATRAARAPCASRRRTGAPRHTRTALCSNPGGVRCNEHQRRFARGRRCPVGAHSGSLRSTARWAARRRRASKTNLSQPV